MLMKYTPLYRNYKTAVEISAVGGGELRYSLKTPTLIVKMAPLKIHTGTKTTHDSKDGASGDSYLD
jgi:hypothetical protein